MFRKLRGLRLPYNVQGYIYFTCANYRQQSKEIKNKIRALCEQTGGQYSDALFDVLTKAGQYSVERIAMEHYVSPETLYRLRRKFYEAWAASWEHS